MDTNFVFKFAIVGAGGCGKSTLIKNAGGVANTGQNLGYDPLQRSYYYVIFEDGTEMNLTVIFFEVLAEDPKTYESLIYLCDASILFQPLSKPDIVRISCLRPNAIITNGSVVDTEVSNEITHFSRDSKDACKDALKFFFSLFFGKPVKSVV